MKQVNNLITIFLGGIITGKYLANIVLEGGSSAFQILLAFVIPVWVVTFLVALIDDLR